MFIVVYVFFFFKEKTAYEMRISDWSSDVCSSDLPIFARVPLLVMPLACILLVAGLTSPNPTLVGGERFFDGAPESPAVGILSVTRHPFLWGTGLWALSHLLANGDLSYVVIMVGIAVLRDRKSKRLNSRH